jgi:hypothetical protein
MSIDVAISGDINLMKKEAAKILKYKDLITEIHRMWNLRATVIPVIVGATGTISKSLSQCLSHVPGKELRKTATLGAAHILRKMQVWKYEAH